MPFHNCWVSGQLGGVDARCSTKENFTVNQVDWKAGAEKHRCPFLSNMDDMIWKQLLRSPIWKVMWWEHASGCSLPVNCACTVKIFDFLVHFYRLNALYISSISLSTCFSSCSGCLCQRHPGWIWAGLCGSCASRCVSMALTVCQCKDWPVWGTLCSSRCCSVVSSIWTDRWKHTGRCNYKQLTLAG